MNQLRSQKVLIVGGSSGIGAATAKAFAALEAVVTIASRSEAKLAAVAADIGGGVHTAVLDVTDAAAVEAFFSDPEPFDHVVVSTTAPASGGVRQLTLADAHKAMDGKFWGAYRVARAAKISTGGSLTLISGYLGVRPLKQSVLQGAINAALDGLARGLALELAPVRVNTVAPGIIATPLWSRMSEEDRQSMFAAAAARLPVGRVGQPEDVANAVLYLATTSYATGSTVLVDGGTVIA